MSRNTTHLHPLPQGLAAAPSPVYQITSGNIFQVHMQLLLHIAKKILHFHYTLQEILQLEQIEKYPS